MAKPLLYGVGVDALKTRLKVEPMGAYLFFGEEEYLKHFYLEKLRDLIDKNGFEELNLVRFEWEGKTVAELSQELDVLPMMGTRRLVEVHGMKPFKLSEREQKSLLALLEQLPDHLILVIYCSQEELVPDRSLSQKPFAQQLAQALLAVNFAHLTENALIGWIQKILATAKLGSTDQAARRMVRLCGQDMQKLRNELYKLEAYLLSQGRNQLELSDVDLFVHGDSDAQSYQLADAVFSRDAVRAAQLFEGLRAQRVEPVILAGSLAKSIGCAALAVSNATPQQAKAAADLADWQMRNYREKLRDYDRSYFAAALQLCLECDRKMKSQGHDGYVLVENLIFTLIKLGVEKSQFYK